MEPEDWIKQFASEIGIEPPSAAEVEKLLNLAGVAAHASARTAAPIACWLAGQSDLSTDELIEVAGRVGG